MIDQNVYLNCLILAQAFETAWAYFSLSDGQLRQRECREIGRELTARLRDLLTREWPVFENDRDRLTQEEALETVDALAAWVAGERDLPHASYFDSGMHFFRLMALVKYG